MQKTDLTVIVIGRNEYPTLGTNLKNLSDFAATSQLKLQVVYVDSESTDGSVELACSFEKELDDFGVIRVEGKMNAAVARNAGIRHARGEYLLFLDGDIVFDCAFIGQALETLAAPQVGAVAGKLLEVYDAEHPERTVERSAHGRTSCRFLGGNFFCRRSVVARVGFFDETLKINEDVDFTVRIANLGLELLEIDVPFGVHFTEPYNDRGRLCRDLMRFNYVYPGILLRKYLFRRGFSSILHSQPGIYLRFVVLLFLFLGVIDPWYALPPAAVFLFITVRVKKHLQETLLSRALSFLKGAEVALGLFWIKQPPRYRVRSVTCGQKARLLAGCGE